MKTYVYILRCLTNLHVGQGDANMSIIDKQIQRDPTTQFPTIHSSGLKGALRQFFDDSLGQGHDLTERLFGAGTQTPGKKQAFGAGKIFFGPGHLLSLPVRSDKHPYFNATTPHILADFIEYLELSKEDELVKLLRSQFDPLIKLSSIEEKRKKEEGAEAEKTQPTLPAWPKVFATAYHGAILEEESYQAHFFNYEADETLAEQRTWRKGVEAILGAPFALMKHPTFQELCLDLPVIARNKLSNGISENLWYEEVIPRETRFYFSVKGEEMDLINFNSKVNKQLIQVGANATVGYGQTLFTLVDTKKPE